MLFVFAPHALKTIPRGGRRSFRRNARHCCRRDLKERPRTGPRAMLRNDTLPPMKLSSQGIARLVRPSAQVALLLFLLAFRPASVASQTSPAGAPPDSFEGLAKSAAAERDAGQTDQAISDYQRALAIRPDWAEGWWSLGVLQYDGDHYSDAITSFTKLTELAPKAGPAWNFLGLCEFETRDYANALVHLERGNVLGNGDDPEIARVSAYHLALLRIRNAQFDSATKLLTSTFDKGPVSAQAKVALGLALLRVPLLPNEVDPSHDALVQKAGEAAALQARGENEKAVVVFQSLLTEYPDTPYLHDAYAKSLEAAGKTTEAQQQHRLAAQSSSKTSGTAASNVRRYAIASDQQVTSQPRDASAEWQQAMSYYAASRYSEAVASLKTYVEKKPQDGTAWAVMGLSEFALKDYDNALLHLQRGQALGFGGSAESVALANYTLGVLLNRQGEFKSATQALASATDSATLAEKARFALGMALLRIPRLPDEVEPSQRALLREAGAIAVQLQQSKYDDAFPRFQSLLKTYPTTPFLHYAYGVALSSLSQFEAADGQMREELKISPQSELPYLRLASIALREHQPEQALEPAQHAAKLAPDSGEAHYLLGRAYLELGQDEPAMRELEKAAALAPNSPEVHFNLAKAYTKAKQPQKAQQEREIFAQLNALAEQQRSLQGNQSYEGPRDSNDVSVSPSGNGVTAQPR